MFKNFSHISWIIISWIICVFLMDSIVVFSQSTVCYNSAFAAYTGGGCTEDCNLTEFSGFSSMCDGTPASCGSSCWSTTLTQYFTIQTGCTATLTASFERRCNGNGCTSCFSPCTSVSTNSGCCNSGLDGNDYLKVGGSTSPTYSNTINLSSSGGIYTFTCGSGLPSTTFTPSGYTITATGKNNGGAKIIWVQTGGTLFLEQRSNRNDEIVTFTIEISGPGCSCSSVLPVDIYYFRAETKNNYVELKWLVKNEKHLSHYRLEKSKDGLNFELLGNIPSENSMTEKLYTFVDDNPYEGISYYKLTVVNLNNEDEKYILRDVLVQYEYQPFTYEIKGDDIYFHFVNTEYSNSYFQLVDISGKKILQISPIDQVEYVYPLSDFSSGFYMGVYFNGKKYFKSKIVITK